MKAAKERKSVAAVIREKLADDKKQRSTGNLLEAMKDLGEEIAKEYKGLNLTKDLLEMRHEQ